MIGTAGPPGDPLRFLAVPNRSLPDTYVKHVLPKRRILRNREDPLVRLLPLRNRDGLIE